MQSVVIQTGASEDESNEANEANEAKEAKEGSKDEKAAHDPMRHIWAQHFCRPSFCQRHQKFSIKGQALPCFSLSSFFFTSVRSHQRQSSLTTENTYSFSFFPLAPTHTYIPAYPSPIHEPPLPFYLHSNSLSHTSHTPPNLTARTTYPYKNNQNTSKK